MQPLLKQVSKVTGLPLIEHLSPRSNITPSNEMIEGYLRCQRLAQRAALEVAGLAREGWTETQAAQLFKTSLMDSGVRAFFHHPFAWFGERSRFEGIKSYSQYGPSKRRLLPGEVFILDAAPIYHGYIADIGYTFSLGNNAELEKAKNFLSELRGLIPSLFQNTKNGGDVWNEIDRKINEAGYTNIHQKYPFSVLGHRIHETNEHLGFLKVLNFGWQSYWTLASRGLFGQLLNSNFCGDLTGLWAIEPHIGTPSFGAKFEEILMVEPNRVKWLEPNPQYGKSFL
ncbi:aminopeptidase P family protein [bacterium]|nr:aminopeptidase P family protein [bacterium]